MKITLTPKMAKEWLLSNTKNRPLRKATVTRYANEINKGNWVYNGESIKISSSNVIIDGQHRLHAVVLSGKSIDIELLTELSDDVFCTIDQGKTRTNSDNFALKEVENYTAVASAINAFYCLNIKTPKSVNSSRLSKKETYEYYIKHKRVLNHKGFKRRYIGAPPKYVNACYSYLLQFNDEHIVDDFFEELFSGKFKGEFGQVSLLREWFIKTAVDKKTTPTPVEYVAKILKSFKNKKAGKNPPFLRWSDANNDKFPFDVDHTVN